MEDFCVGFTGVYVLWDKLFMMFSNYGGKSVVILCFVYCNRIVCNTILYDKNQTINIWPVYVPKGCRRAHDIDYF